MSTSFKDMPGCTITTECRTSTYLEVYLVFKNTEVKTATSPQFTINGVINFFFKIEKRNTERFILVRFERERLNDISEYCITFTWNKENTKFETLNKWYFIYSGTLVDHTVTVNVDLKTLSSPCASLYEDTEWTDFKLVGDDGFVLLHKVIAAAHSPFFKNMLSGQWKESTEGVIEVSGISKQTLEHLKEYMYLGTFPNLCVKQLLVLSKFYMMEDLENRCLFKLRAELNKENIFELIEFAVANKQTRLLYEVLDVAQQGDIKVKELKNF